MADERTRVVCDGERIAGLGPPVEYAVGGEVVVERTQRRFVVRFEVVDPADGSVWVVHQLVDAVRKEPSDV